MAHITPIRRAARPGLPDGSSERGVYVARWIDEDTGSHEARVEAASRADAEAFFGEFVPNNTLRVEGPVRRAGA